MEIIDQIFKFRKNFILLGLTGRTGSGCSTLAQILALSKEQFISEKLDCLQPISEGRDNNERKELVVRKYIRENWQQFTIIKASDFIAFYALLVDFGHLVTALSVNVQGKAGMSSASDVTSSLMGYIDQFDRMSKEAHKCNELLSKVDSASLEDCQTCFQFMQMELPNFKHKLREVLGNKYIAVFQELGNNIRLYDAVSNFKDSTDYLADNSPSCLAVKIDQYVNLIKKLNNAAKKPTCIVIDALRNPYEILYFRERYAAFYLLSMNTTENGRKQNLTNKNYTEEQIKAIDGIEKGKKDVTEKYQQIDIDKCIELSDIHLSLENSLSNSKRCVEQVIGFPNVKEKLSELEEDLIKQIITYVSLIMHPGLIPPSPYERIMQIAYTAKLNSGCLSRQVGAVVTNNNLSIKAIGWNTAPEGQTPCTLRCLNDLCDRCDQLAYSSFEKERPFITYAEDYYNQYKSLNYKEKLKGISLSYCFKDVYTTSNPDQTHNQVHTRSLHAEENAFLQLAKYGSTGIQGGFLFSTASCCELCAKKAYQLGIKKIYYIDSYPGITQKHILECGMETSRPQMILFKGAVGRAYMNLFNPIIPLKDEIQTATGLDVKKDKLDVKKERSIS